MIGQLNCFNFISELANTILECVIAITIVVCLVIMLKYPTSRQFIIYVFGILAIIIGIFSGIGLSKELSQKSYINGTIDDINMWSQEEFNYSSTNLTFYDKLYDNADTYHFEIDLLKVDDFNGLTKKYIVTLNDYMLISNISAGYISAIHTMHFFNTDNELLCAGKLTISIEFLSDKTRLKIFVENNEQAQYFEKYFKENGIRLKVEEIKGGIQ